MRLPLPFGFNAPALALAVGLGASTVAAAPPSVGIAYPMGGRRGTTVEINFYGENLGEATAAIFTGEPGLSAELVSRDAKPAGLLVGGGGLTEVRENARVMGARVTIAPDAPLGEREVRLLSPDGVSSPVRFVVGDLPEIAEDPSNTSPEKARRLELPVVVNDAIRRSAESDHYVFAATKGRKIVVDVDAFRIGSSLDSTLTILDAEGRELARNEDADGLDSRIDFDVPADGDYRIEIRDIRYGGSGNHHYRLTVGEVPRLDRVFPLGGRRGEVVELEFAGVNLAGAEKMKRRIEPDAPVGTRELRVTTPAGISNPIPFDVNDARDVREVEPNAAMEQTVPLGGAPVVANGRIDEPGDADLYRFDAKKGRRLAFEVFARRFGSPIDAVIELLDAEGRVLARDDDGAGVDARLEFADFPDDGPRFVRVADLLERGGPAFAYRLNIYEPRPDFNARYFPESPVLSRGGRAVVRVETNKGGGLFTATEFRFEGLPAGVTARPLLLPADHPPSGWMTLEASEDAALGATPLRLVATANVEGRREERVASPVIPQGDGRDANADRFVRQGYLVVRDRAPFALNPITLTAHATQGGSTTVDLAIRRAPGFDGPVEIRLAGYTFGREGVDRSLSMDPVVAAAGQDRATATIRARADAEPGTRPIHFVGKTSLDGVDREEPSPTMPMTVYEIPFTISNPLRRLAMTALPEGASSAASEASLQVLATRRGLFTQPIRLELEGLPEGVVAEIPEIAPDSGEVRIAFRATDKAPVGKVENLVVVGRATVGERKFEHRAEPVTLEIQAPETEGADGAESEEAAAAAP